MTLKRDLLASPLPKFDGVASPAESSTRPIAHRMTCCSERFMMSQRVRIRCACTAVTI